MFSDPPGAAPDEPANYIRAVSVGRLEILGQPSNGPSVRTPDPFGRRANRSVGIPPGLAVPESWYCTVIDHSVSGRCLYTGPQASTATRQDTYVGAYEPTPYFFPGLATRLARDPVSALLLARLTGALVALPFLVAAIWLLWEEGEPTSLVGLVMALTPMLIFSVSLSPSGAEVTSSVCVVSAAIRLSREPGSKAALLALGVSGSVLASWRALGPLWIAAAAMLLLLLVGPGGLRKLREGSPRLAAFVGSAVGASVALGLAWEVAELAPSPHSPAQLAAFVIPALASLPETFGEAIGVFGWVDTLMPKAAYAIWGLAEVALVATALLVGRRREVRLLELLIFAAGGFVVLLTALVVLPAGAAAQGRYMLPVLVVIPLFAGEILWRRRTGTRAAWGNNMAIVLVTVAGSIQFVGVYTNAHRFAVGLSGPWWFLGAAEWQPPLGWAAWMLVALLGAVCIVFSVWATVRTRPGSASQTAVVR